MFLVVCFLLTNQSWAVSNISLTFDGTGSTVAATGFENAYNFDPSGFSLGGGKLTITTLPGDMFGDYENDPDTAKNVFHSAIERRTRTIVTTHVNIQGLNVNFHGGGIWLGTDQDHYFRLGIINNTFEGGISGEGLRENEDRWVNSIPPGQGDDIVNRQFPNVGTSPQLTPINAILRIDRIGNNVRGFFSTDGGANFNQLGGTGFAYVGLATGPDDPQGNGSNTVEGTFKTGLYAFGGPDGSIPATFAFDDFAATSYFAGDTNLDGKVDVADLGVLASNWQSTTGTWATGDFTDDGKVDVADLGLLATNWQAGVAGAASSLGLPGASSAAVPEPAVLGWLAMTAVGLWRRRLTVRS
jgi:hypothetical protein